MAYIRNKKNKGKTYYYIVQTKREKNKVKQKVIKYLGNIENVLKVYKYWEENH